MLEDAVGFLEAPVDDGLSVWVGLRDALLRNEVVLMQGDRVMPGQRGMRLPFLSGHMVIAHQLLETLDWVPACG